MLRLFQTPTKRVSEKESHRMNGFTCADNSTCSWSYLLEEPWFTLKLKGVAPLIAEPSQCKCTDRQNPPVNQSSHNF